MSRRAEGEEDVFCCYGGLCHPDEQSKECREEGDYSVEKNITGGTVGQCILRLKGKARAEDAGNYNAEFLGDWNGNQLFKINVKNAKKAGPQPETIILSGCLVSVILVIVVLWKKWKGHLARSKEQGVEDIQLVQGDSVV